MKHYAIAFCAIQDSWFDGGHSFIVLFSQEDQSNQFDWNDLFLQGKHSNQLHWSDPFSQENGWRVERSFGFNPKPHGLIKNYYGSFTGHELPGHVVHDKSKMFGSPNIRCNIYPTTEYQFREILHYIDSSRLHPTRFSSAAVEPDFKSHAFPSIHLPYSCVSFAKNIVHYAIKGQFSSLPNAPSHRGMQTNNIPRVYWWHSLEYALTLQFNPNLGTYFGIFQPISNNHEIQEFNKRLFRYNQIWISAN